MRTEQATEELKTVDAEKATLHATDRRTLQAIFAHPLAHNLAWADAIHLIGKLGSATEQSNNEFLLDIDGHTHVMHKPHSKDLTTDVVLELRHFIMKAGHAPSHPSEAASHPDPASPDLLVVIDHHGAEIFHVDVAGPDGSVHVIKPYDPHGFLHHLKHKDQSRERGQRAPEEPAYYEKIAETVALAGRIVIIGHGTGKSNASHHFADYLQAHHIETYQRVVPGITADLSARTPAQLLDLARQALHTQ